jgi:hypothetical protein
MTAKNPRVFVRCALVALGALGASNALRSAPARAQPVSRIESSIRASQARAALRRGDESEAVRLYRESIALHPDPDALRALAMIYERRNERRLAGELWMRLSGLARTPSERAQSAERAELLRTGPALLRVWVQPAEASRRARVWFDRDVPRPVPVGGAEATVEGGPHRVRVEAPGFAVFEVMISTGWGESREVIARMRPLSGAPDAGARD